jgi:recombinational DNA repair protein (RecF pathway)
MNLEGILIHKTAVKERDLIGKLLLRSGKVVNLYFYGGQGGGKYSKGSILEIGHMLKVTLAPQKKKLETQLHTVKEYGLIWDAAFIRKNYQAFYLLSLYAEVVQKIAVEENLENQSEFQEHQEIFKVVSNAIFCLDDSIKKDCYALYQQLFIFLTKLNFELGVLPDYEQCLHCQVDLNKIELARFEPQQGGFICCECLLRVDQSISEDKVLFEELKSSIDLKNALVFTLHTPYKEYEKLTGIARGHCNSMFNYFCYQFDFTPSHFKTWNMLAAL